MVLHVVSLIDFAVFVGGIVADNLQLNLPKRAKTGERLWCDQSDWEGTLNQLALTDDDKIMLAHFVEKGYLLIKGGLPRSIADAAIAEYEALIEKSAVLRDLATKNGRLPNVHKYTTTGKQVFTRAPEALRFQDILFGYRSSVYTSLYFRYGTQQPIHRDVPVFRTQPENFYFGVWYGLEDATVENGALRAIPGGHRVNTVDHFALAAQHTNDADSIHPSESPMWTIYQTAVAEQCKQQGLNEISIEMEKGDVLIWHPLLPHGGGKIISEQQTRQSIVYHVVPEGCPVYQMDVFFNRTKQDVSDLASWSYDLFEDRLFAAR